MTEQERVAIEPAKESRWKRNCTIGLVVAVLIGSIAWVVIDRNRDANRKEEAASAARAKALGVLQDADSACGEPGELADKNQTLILDGQGRDDVVGIDFADIACVLEELDVPKSVVAKMDSTRAMDGRQEAEWDRINASWVYHPDSGAEILLTLDEYVEGDK